MSDVARLTCVADISRLHGRERPDAVAIDFRERMTTYGELDGRASQVANGLLALEQRPGARVGYIGKNLDLFWDVVLGSFKSRTVIVGVNWRLAPPEMMFVVDDAECEVLFVGRDFYSIVRKILPDLPRVKQVIAMDGDHPEWPDFGSWRDAQPKTDPMLPSKPDDDVLQVYTSGTTGLPKGVCLSNANYLSAFLNRPTDVPSYGRDDVVLVAMPFFHVAGINMGVISLAHGARAIMLQEPDAREILRLIPLKGVTQSMAVPAVILAIIQLPEAQAADFSSLRSWTYGGSPIPEDVLSQATKILGCDFVQNYGMTESTSAITYLPPADHDPARGKLRSCGLPMPGREVRVVDDTGASVPTGQVGEIVVRSACVMRGYWKRPEAMAEAVDTEGWLHTGDAGYADADGYLYIYDRVKEMIVSGGENIYPAEVENAIAGHPAVQDVAVIGVPDVKWGEAVKAIIASKSGASVDPAEIIGFARERIAGYKLPKSVDFVETIPRNASGKILRRDLRRPYWEGRERQVN